MGITVTVLKLVCAQCGLCWQVGCWHSFHLLNSTIWCWLDGYLRLMSCTVPARDLEHLIVLCGSLCHKHIQLHVTLRLSETMLGHQSGCLRLPQGLARLTSLPLTDCWPDHPYCHSTRCQLCWGCAHPLLFCHALGQ